VYKFYRTNPFFRQEYKAAVGLHPALLSKTVLMKSAKFAWLVMGVYWYYHVEVLLMSLSVFIFLALEHHFAQYYRLHSFASCLKPLPSSSKN
jgi:hypothetical protein